MAELDGKITYQLRLESWELVLVLKALGGRLRENEVTHAKQLGDDLTRLRAGVARSTVAWANRLDKAVGAAPEPERQEDA
jgi:hypothetical protein